MSIKFIWNESEIYELLDSCEKDTVLPFIKKYIKKDSKILESGCGLGRWVKYLHDQNYNVTGLELSSEAVDSIKKIWPELKITQGDASNSPFADESLDVVISLGVVEHWVEGPEEPLQDIYRILNKGGIGIITVPCLNKIRKIKYKLFLRELALLPRTIFNILRKNKIAKFNRFNKKFKYIVSPFVGNFFEYHMSPEQFTKEVKNVGFTILEHKPVAEIDGIYHELNFFGLLIKFKNWKFHQTFISKLLNKILKIKPFIHCHMQIVIVRK